MVGLLMKARAGTVLVVFVTAGSAIEARRIGQSVVKARLAACATILPSVHSIYRWKSKVVKDREAVLMLKTTKDRYHKLERSIRGMHSYETPEIIAVPVELGLPQYLAWVARETVN